MVTIRRLPSVEHHFELVVTRVYEDEDQELLEDEDESTSIPMGPQCLNNTLQ
jgi:VID27 N-terminal region